MDRSGAHILPTSLVLLGAIAVAVVALDNRSAKQAPEKNQEFQAAQAHLEAVRRRISAENAGSAANQDELREAATQADAVPPAAEDLPPAPPGYSYTNAPTQLKLAPYEATPEAASPNESMPLGKLDWLSPDAFDVHAILRRAHHMGRGWVFGWLRLADGAKVGDVRRAAAPLGIDILGTSGRLLRAKLPADEARLTAVAATDAVSGLAVVPPDGKAAPGLVAQVNATAASVPALITLMSSDQDGLWRRELQKLGAEVGRFDADTRTYAANVDGIVLEALVQADFVLAVEPMYLFRAAHDTAVPAMGADAVRSRTNQQGVFRGAGGGSAPIGVMDTGLNTNHPDIATHRQSICGASFVSYDPRNEDADLWVDEDGHGTHVTGTIVGNGAVEAKYAGMAPAVAHIRFAKVLTRNGWGWSYGIFRGMDFLARATGCAAGAAVKPLIVNMSLSATSRQFHGRTSPERKLDAVVWAHRQLYVVAQSNANIHGFSNYGAAKNSLSVGAIEDNGELAGFSSWGPTFDGRLAPQVVATGVDVYSAAGQGQPGGYMTLNGTSMAAPSAAGVAALLMDAVTEYREQPALVRARLMASAIKPDAWLGGTSSAFPTTNSTGPGVLQAQFGLGKASARTSVLQRERADGWENHAATATLEGDSYGYQDIVVPQGTSRLDLVLAWDEPPADTIGGTVLNDLDLWLDKDGDCSLAACGEYASRSRRDNVEWIIVKNPAPGTYRARVVPHLVYTAAPRAGLAWTIVRGASTPNLRLEVDDVRPFGNGQHRIALALSTNAYVAAGAQIALNGCRLLDGTRCPNQKIVEIRPVAAEDGSESLPEDDAGRVLVGEVGVGERQIVELDVMLIVGTSTATRLYFTASAWNAEPAKVSVGLPAHRAIDGVHQQPPAELVTPSNDHFSAAADIEGASGSVDVDMLAATFEPGEPLSTMSRERRRSASSVWHRWVAPTRGAVRFSISANVRVDALQGDQLASLTQLASNPWGISFFADQGETYHVRVSDDVRDDDTMRSGPPAALTLHWSQGPRPVNDDFASAALLEGTEGSVSGNNGGATLEPGEQFGDLAATVWYRWTAPEDGAMDFSTDASESKVLVFTGSAVSALRLVSGHPDTPAQVPVKAGTEYLVAVAATDAFAATRSFDLSWQPYERSTSNDDFAHARRLTGATGERWVTASDSVEPDEPAQTEVRSRWLHWTAPLTGRFAWHLTDSSLTALKVTVFELAETDGGASLANLVPLASTGPTVTSTELGFSAVSGRRYWISVGFHSGDYAAFSRHSTSSASLQWSQVPANDQLSHAATLSGGSGSATIANLSGTLEPNEPSGPLGHSSLWWWFTSPAAGWYRFSVEGAPNATLAVYRTSGRGFAGLQRLASSRDWQAADEVVAALFNAAAEERYLIRVGQRGEYAQTEATLSWEAAAAPTWLRYIGRLPAAAFDFDSELALRSHLTIDHHGEALYLSAPNGLHVLRRNPGDGMLEQIRFLDSGITYPRSAMLWDRHRSKLYVMEGSYSADSPCNWRQFAPTERWHLNDEGRLHDDGQHCAATALFMDPAGAFLYHGHRNGIEVFAFGEAGLTKVQSLELANLEHAQLDGDGTHVYAINRNSLLVLSRDQEGGTLTTASEITMDHSAQALAISDDDVHLFALGAGGASAVAYEIKDGGASLQYADSVRNFGTATWRNDDSCSTRVSIPDGIVMARSGPPAFDAFCRNSAFVAAMRIEDGSTQLQPQDYLANWHADRFNNYIPEFDPRAVVASPDGKHAYVLVDGFSGGNYHPPNGGILIFERIGNPPPTVDDSED